MQKLLPLFSALVLSFAPCFTAQAALIVTTDLTSWENGTTSTLVTDFEGLAPNDQPPGGNFISSNSFTGTGATIAPLNANGFVFSVVDRDYMGSDYFEPEATQSNNTGFTITFDNPTDAFSFDFANFGLGPMRVTVTIGSDSVSLFNSPGVKGFFGITSDTTFTTATITAIEVDGDGNPVLDEFGDPYTAGYPSYDNIRSISTVPEPGTYGLLLGSLTAVWAIRRRRC